MQFMMLTDDSTDFKLALKSALYDFTSCRDFYREATLASGIGMHKDLITRYVELQALLLTPIAPHWSDYIWQEILHKDSTVQNALWPSVPESDSSLAAAREYVRGTTSAITSAESAQLKKKTKGKTISYDPKQPKKLIIFAAKNFPGWQQKYIDLLRESFEKASISGDGDSKAQEKELVEKVGKMGEAKKAMPFVQGLRRRIGQGEKPAAVFERKLAFDEGAVLTEMVKGLKKTTGCKVIEVVMVDEGAKSGEVIIGDDGKSGGKRDELPQAAEGAIPGTPTFHFENVSA
jgi:leucyl-tRNA synthetase